MIYEGKDCSVAILDEHGDVLGQSLGLPPFLGNLEICVKLAAEHVRVGRVQAGRCLLHERLVHDRHASERRHDLRADLLARAVRVGFSATRAHWLDVGGKDPGGPMDSSSIFQEGMRWAPTKFYDGGEPRADIIDLLAAQRPLRLLAVGDMNAQVAACRTGETRFQAILDRFGYETYVASRSEIYRQSEELERAAVSAIPTVPTAPRAFSTMTATDMARSRCTVRIDIAGDSMEIDLADSCTDAPRPRQLRFRPDDLGLPRRIQAADQPAASGGRWHLQDARSEGT